MASPELATAVMYVLIGAVGVLAVYTIILGTSIFAIVSNWLVKKKRNAADYFKAALAINLLQALILLVNPIAAFIIGVVATTVAVRLMAKARWPKCIASGIAAVVIEWVLLLLPGIIIGAMFPS